MKNLKFILVLVLLTLGFSSCSSDNDDNILVINPLEEYNLISKIEDNGHHIELYAENQDFIIGYNEIMIRIKDEVTGEYFSNPTISWIPMMHMMNMKHSAPKSNLSIMKENNTISKGFLVFQMASNSEEFWDITFNYKIDGKEYVTTQVIDVKAPKDKRQQVTSFLGNDETKYVLAMVSPKTPEVTINDFKAVLFKMEDMMTFSVVKDFKVGIDPRMPGMGNHSSPNNKDLTYDETTKCYIGKLSLTMTGYWKINMTLFNEVGELIKGEALTEEQESSSLYFELEF
ncbi:hypothetical protein [Arenibacter latericius]|uniref:hypothetical protein n=1 Tax=Arenibacter latericius TaxID=86104 RepID=UPI00041DAD9A|nr:hypothetical protein [Arenibacter latericius]